MPFEGAKNFEDPNSVPEAEKDLSTPEGVVTLMQESKSEHEWNDNCEKVKKAHGGYPDWWYEKIVSSGLSSKKQMEWEMGM